MRAQTSGAIVNISSQRGQVSFAGNGAYSASKFALEGLTEALKLEVEPLGIKVMIVEPGAFRTEFLDASFKHMPQIDAYDATVGFMHKKAASLNQKQKGDPAKAAKAIDLALKASATPLRLVIGNDAVDTIKAHALAVIKDIADWEDVARATVFTQD